MGAAPLHLKDHVLTEEHVRRFTRHLREGGRMAGRGRGGVGRLDRRRPREGVGSSPTPVRRHHLATATDRRFLLLVCGAVVVARLSTLWMPLRADEGGYLLVARQWHSGGEFMYGDYFVDRPPLLLLLFRLAALGGWDGWIRVIAVPFAVLLVLASWRAGAWVGGARGARWSTAVGAAVVCSPAVSADAADGELFSTVLGMVAIALALEAWGTPTLRRAGCAAVAAGALATAAPLVKQNALEGAVVLGVLVVLGLRLGGPARERAVVMGTAAAVGGASAAVPVLVWLWAGGVEPALAWYDVFAFRGQALEVIWSDRPRATVVRAVQLVVLATVSGFVGVLFTWGSALRRYRMDCSPVVPAITALVPFGLLSIAAGGSFWPSYLLQLLPVVVLVVGVMTPSVDRVGARARAWARLVVGAAVVAWVTELVIYAVVPGVWFQQRTGEWLSASSAPGDTAVVLYGHPSVLEAADLRSPYPFLWSVPVRTLDGDLQRLRTTLAGEDAPGWLVEMNPLDSWGIDESGRLRDVVEDRYRVVAEVCGRRMHLREDLERTPAPPMRC